MQLPGRLGVGTAARTFVESLSEESNLEELKRLCTLDEGDRKRKRELAQALKGDPPLEVRRLLARSHHLVELDALAARVEALVSPVSAAV